MLYAFYRRRERARATIPYVTWCNAYHVFAARFVGRIKQPPNVHLQGWARCGLPRSNPDISVQVELLTDAAYGVGAPKQGSRCVGGITTAARACRCASHALALTTSILVLVQPGRLPTPSC